MRPYWLRQWGSSTRHPLEIRSVESHWPWLIGGYVIAFVLGLVVPWIWNSLTH